MKLLQTGFALAHLLAVLSARAQPLVPIPFVADPPPAIDGTLKRFETTPGWLSLEKAGNVVYGQNLWRGPNDLSARVLATWDPQNLYIAARVRDRGMQQPYQSANLWKGSHVMLLLDFPRQPEGSRSAQKLIHIGLSPGNPADPAPRAEIIQWKPKEGEIPGARIAAQVMADSYQLEAAIPWQSLGIDAPSEGTPLGIDIAVSSSDRPGEVTQDKLMSLLTTSWKLRDPNRLANAALANPGGVIDPARLPQPAVPLGGERTVAPGQSSTTLLPPPEGMATVKELILKARINSPKPAGGTHTLRLFLNGEELGVTRIRNRTKTMEMGALSLSNHSRDHWYLLYTPDFTPPDRNSTYFVADADPFEFRFDVHDLWKPGAPNELKVEHFRDKAEPLHYTVAASSTLSPKKAEPQLRAAPTGEIPTYQPLPPLAKGSLRGQLREDGAITVDLAGRKWEVQSAFSLPEGRWATLGGEGDPGWMGIEERSPTEFITKTPGYTLHRRIEVRADHIAVLDELTNTSDDDLPVMTRHFVDLPAADRSKVYLCGRSFGASEIAIEEGENPTSLVLAGEQGLGMVSEDDIMRVQADNFYDEERVGIRNQRFVLAKGKRITLEFSIYPLEAPDQYLFINRVRHNWGVNRTIPGAFATLGASRETRGLKGMSDTELERYLQFKGVMIGCILFPYHDDIATHGGRFKEYAWKAQADYVTTLKALQPGLKVLPYYHSFISNGQGDIEHYADSAILSADGKQLFYGNREAYPLFAPVAGSAFARLQEDLVEARFALGVDGIYWDEYEYSQAKYQFSPDVWDGVTGDIDLRTHRLRRRISSLTLLTLPWRKAMAESILRRGILFGNSQPLTRTFTQLDFPRFIETASMSNLVKGQLGTPLALGDHLTEINERDAYRNMVKGLDYSALYAWYATSIIPTAPTFASFMYPSTPVALGHGFLIAKERILTNTSGYFGWGDESEFEAAIFNRQGRQTDEITIPRVIREGRVYAEVRIPEGYAVALIRKTK